MWKTHIQTSKDIQLQFYCTDGLLIREMFYTYTNSKNTLYLHVGESPTKNIVCPFNITKRDAAKKITSYNQGKRRKRWHMKNVFEKVSKANTTYC